MARPAVRIVPVPLSYLWSAGTPFNSETYPMKLSAAAAGLLIWSCFPAVAQQSGAILYGQHCAQCHDSGDAQNRSPNRSALQSMSFEHVLRTITSGSMAA